MSRKCTICTHSEQASIDRALLQGAVLRNIAERYGVSTTSLHRHFSSGHIARRLVKSKEAKEIAHANTLMEQVKDLQQRAMGILDNAEASNDLRTACTAIREARSCLELLAKVTGELENGSSIAINLIDSHEWINLRTKILIALEPFPEARRHLVTALEGEK